MSKLQGKYRAISNLGNKDLGSIELTELIISLVKDALLELRECKKVSLSSPSIQGKQYFVFEIIKHYSRPINKALFMEEIPGKLYDYYLNLRLGNIEEPQLSKFLYTAGMSYCAAIDILGTSDKKTPSVFFEKYIGNIFAREYSVNPIQQIELDLDEIKTMLPTDYLFQPPDQFIKIHLPIKLSTRERSIQAWAHQRVLEGIHGVGKYRGVMVVLGETNFQSKGMSVVEVCLPEQWRVYQMYISRMTRVYYLDLPKKYAELPGKFPHIQVKPFSEFFQEKGLLILKKAMD